MEWLWRLFCRLVNPLAWLAGKLLSRKGARPPLLPAPAPTDNAHQRAVKRAEEIDHDLERIESERVARREGAGAGAAPVDVLGELDLPPLRGPGLPE